MAPPRRQTKPTKAPNVQIIDFTTTGDEDTIECELPIDPQLLLFPQPHAESHTESCSESQPPTPSLDDYLIELNGRL
jgi:hypothetical protein